MLTYLLDVFEKQLRRGNACKRNMVVSLPPATRYTLTHDISTLPFHMMEHTKQFRIIDPEK